MFNIWKVEKDWKGLTKHEVQIIPSINDTDSQPAPREGYDEQERVTNEEADQSRDENEANNTCGESGKQLLVVSQDIKLMDEKKDEQRPWEETPDTSVSVGATAGLINRASRETVGVGQ